MRVFRQTAEIRDSGIQFLANHDLWMHDYFQKELNIVYHNNKNILCGKNFFNWSWRRKGPGDKVTNDEKYLPICFLNVVFRWLHPDISVKLAQYLKK
jgi:UDP-2,3-diacylglucosamine hydrolase